MDKKISDGNVALNLDAAQIHAARIACQERIKELASGLTSTVTNMVLLEEMGYLIEALLVIGATITDSYKEA